MDSHRETNSAGAGRPRPPTLSRRYCSPNQKGGNSKFFSASFAKLGVDDRTAAVTAALERGILRLEPDRR